MTNAAPKTDYKGELVKLDAVEQALAGLREKYGTVPDMQTKEGYDLCKKGIKELTTYRTSTDKLRKEITKPHRDFIDRVNQYGKDLIEKLEAIEKPLKDAKQHEDERAEREKQQRIAKLRERIQVEILSYKDTAVGLDSNALAELHDEAVNINTDGYFDVTKEAEDAKAEVLQHIIEMHSRALEKERLAAEQAELEAERRRLREENEKREAEQKELEELRRFKAEQEAKRNPEPQPQPKPEPEPAPLPAAAEHKPLNTSRLSAAAQRHEAEVLRGGQVQAPEQVTISRGEYDQLLADQAKLRALEAMGVDNWSGYEQAMQQLAA
jgi:chromosome segregation ATPase